ncbi:Uncharacterised protein [Kluyvera cryocrescens]|uniref:Uncharacterized protein n=1 Tax=Kluyvera cryocrescens TaxID=580 RepID=A0A485AIQ7_KLUCR|nr:Uncharacterised protein [Kluyvera cryocrescens]
MMPSRAKTCIFLNVGLGDVKSGRLLNVQVFNSSALYTPTPGTKKAIVEVQGAGGAGAGYKLSSNYVRSFWLRHIWRICKSNY